MSATSSATRDPAGARRQRLHYVDFDGLRTGASFGDLAPHARGVTAVPVELPGASRILELGDDASYLAAIAATLRPAPQLLAGYCAGASVACRLAGLLESEGRGPSLLVLIDPQPVGEAGLREQYAALLGKLGASADGAASLHEMRAALACAYDAFAATLPPADRELLAPQRDETLDRYVEWLAFVRAGDVAPPGHPAAPAHVLLSAEAAVPEWARALRPGLTRVPVEAGALLGAPAAGEQLARLAGAGGGP